MKKLGGKYAKDFGYERFVGMEIKETDRQKGELKEVLMKIEDVPFPVSLMVHPEDILSK